MPTNYYNDSPRIRRYLRLTREGHEIWRDVRGWEGFYQVSNFGQVKTEGRVIKQPYGRGGSCRLVEHHHPPKIMKLTPCGGRSNDDYLAVGFRNKEHFCHELVHRVVLEAFVGLCPVGLECRHLDGNPRNNRLDNICWGSKEEQFDDRRKHGTLVAWNAGRCLLSNEQQDEICYLYSLGGESHRSLALRYGVSFPVIGKVLRRRGVEKGAT